MNKRYLLASLIGCFLTGFSFITSKKLIFNITDSVPVGLYWIQSGVSIPQKSLIVFRFKESWLIKEVLGGSGDWFCVSQKGDFSVNGKWLGIAQEKNRHGRLLERVEGCQKVALKEWVVRGFGERSFDSRYLGTVKQRDILGKVTRLGGKKPEAKAEGKIKQ